MKKIIYSFILATALMFASCSQEYIDPQHVSSADDLQIKLNLTGAASEPGSRVSQPGTPVEDGIQTVLLLFYDGPTQSRYGYVEVSAENPIYGRDQVWDQATQTFTWHRCPLDKSKIYKIIAIVNKGNSNTTIDAGGYPSDFFGLSLDQLNSARTSFLRSDGLIANPTINSGLLMTGEVDADLATNKNISITLERQLAKVEVTVKLDPAFAAAFPDVEWANDKNTEPKPMTVSLEDIPTKAFLLKQNKLPPAASVALDGLGPFIIKRTDSQWPMLTIYTHENPLDYGGGVKPVSNTYLDINIPYKLAGVANDLNYYRVLLLDDKGAPMKIDRNSTYQVAVTIKGFGINEPAHGINNIYARVVAKPWTSYPINVEIPKPVEVKMPAKAIVDYVNAAEQADFKFYSNQSEISVENSTTYLSTNGSSVSCNVSDFFHDLQGLKSPNIRVDNNIATVTLRTTGGYRADMVALNMTFNIKGVKKTTQLYFRYIYDLHTETPLSANITTTTYNGRRGEVGSVGNGGNGQYITELFVVDTDSNIEPPYARFEVSPQPTSQAAWTNAIGDCSSGWRLPRIREAARLTPKFSTSQRLNCAKYGSSIVSATQNDISNFWSFAQQGSEYKAVPRAFIRPNSQFRCVRELQPTK